VRAPPPIGCRRPGHVAKAVDCAPDGFGSGGASTIAYRLGCFAHTTETVNRTGDPNELSTSPTQPRAVGEEPRPATPNWPEKICTPPLSGTRPGSQSTSWLVTWPLGAVIPSEVRTR